AGEAAAPDVRRLCRAGGALCQRGGQRGLHHARARGNLPHHAPAPGPHLRLRRQHRLVPAHVAAEAAGGAAVDHRRHQDAHLQRPDLAQPLGRGGRRRPGQLHASGRGRQRGHRRGRRPRLHRGVRRPGRAQLERQPRHLHEAARARPRRRDGEARRELAARVAAGRRGPALRPPGPAQRVRQHGLLHPRLRLGQGGADLRGRRAGQAVAVAAHRHRVDRGRAQDGRRPADGRVHRVLVRRLAAGRAAVRPPGAATPDRGAEVPGCRRAGDRGPARLAGAALRRPADHHDQRATADARRPAQAQAAAQRLEQARGRAPAAPLGAAQPVTGRDAAGGLARRALRRRRDRRGRGGGGAGAADGAARGHHPHERHAARRAGRRGADPAAAAGVRGARAPGLRVCDSARRRERVAL
ncbi:MAG: hypothetical protein M1832_001353, partial [Thelocarpon impressellum]